MVRNLPGSLSEQSRLNSRVDELVDELEVLKKQREDLEEVEGDVELLEMEGDEDDEEGGKILYVSCFVLYLPSDFSYPRCSSLHFHWLFSSYVR
jgi:uncharacterized protein Yka (UPF0111/DUF47 family)